MHFRCIFCNKYGLGTILESSFISNIKTMVLPSKEYPLKEEKPANQEQQWDNPQNPEKAADERDIEQLKRQKKDVDQKNENLTEKPKN